jgi:beta-phosphoglucomutase-like phosphatase (HAD superfamily)
VIFDLDGTLVDTVETRIEAWMRTFAEVGIPADRSHVARLIGADGKRLVREVAEVAGRRIDDARAEAMDKRSGAIYDELNTDPRPVPGARELLLALSGSPLPWAIATSSRKEQVGTSVEALKLPSQPRIVDGSHVEHAKPAPDLLLLAAEQLGVPAPTCWYVGDSTWDMLASRAARMIGIGVPYGAVSAVDLSKAGASVVTTFEELLADLRRRGQVPGR